MAKFPLKETEILELANNISTGLAAHAADFPDIDPIEFNVKIAEYNNSKGSAENARSAATIAVASKNDTLDELVDAMKDILKKAEFDCADNPQKLTEIGWAPKTAPVAYEAPNSPSNLVAVFVGTSQIKLQWEKSVRDSHKPVNNYIVQRRDQLSPGGEFGQWSLADMAYKNETELIGQPKGVKLQYKVFATNSAGQSMESNIVEVVL